MGKGKLTFKGADGPSKKNIPAKHRIEPILGQKLQEAQDTRTNSSQDEKVTVPTSSMLPESKSVQAQAPTLKLGEGKIISSGTVLTGIGTRFQSCLNAGDAILVDVSSLGKSQQEMRIVTMRLSDTSAAISTAFSSDLKLPTSFSFIEKPRDFRSEQMSAKKKEAMTKEEIERHAFGTYGGGAELVYRERTEHGSYRIKKEELPIQSLNRSELLEKRAKKTSDKYC
jgi:hypothetical protein